MASPNDSGSGGGGGESRASQSVLAAPAFRTPTMARVEAASSRTAQKWAPDGAAAARGPGMGALRFVDRHLVSYLGGPRPRVRGERTAPDVNWLFPIPWWYRDEVSWLAAAGAATSESMRQARREPVRMPTVVAPAAPVASSTRVPERVADPGLERAADRAMQERARQRAAVAERAALRAAERAAQERSAQERSAAARSERVERFDLPMELVAPALAGARGQGAVGSSLGGGSLPSHRAAWRAYSPLVDGAAARAAEFLAELVVRRGVAGSGSGSAAGSRGGEAGVGEAGEAGAPGAAWRSAPLLAYVTPYELAGGASGDAAAAAALHAAARRAIEERAAARARGVAAASGAVARGAAASGLAPSGAVARGAAAGAVASAAEQAARAQMASLQAAGSGLAGAGGAGAPESGAATTAGAAAAPARVVSARARALELLAAGALAGQPEQVAPASGPRVMMPAGLGGLVAASAAARAIHQPAALAASAETASPVATHALAAERPAALDHVLWADRWLARFAGASPAALRSFEGARTPMSLVAPTLSITSGEGGVTVTSGAAGWTPEWVSPRRGGQAVAAAPRGAAGQAAPALTTVVVDEGEPVSDSVFGAIAAAAAADRARAGARARAGRPGAAPAGARPAAPAPAELTGSFRAPLADRALAGLAVGGSAGLGASLAASPMASILSGLVEVAPQTSFDARQLSLATVRDFLVRGSMARPTPVAPLEPGEGELASPALLERLAARAPGSVWLALPGLSGGSAAPAAAGVAAGGAAGMTAAALRELVTSRSGAASVTGSDAARAAAGVAGPAGTATATTDAMAATIGQGMIGPGMFGGTAAELAGMPAGVIPGLAGTAAATQATAMPAPRPGDIAVRAEWFAHARTAAASDMALDFLAPEVLAAARAAGMGPMEAVRAQRLAASGRPHLAALAAAVDRVFVDALSPAPARDEETAMAVRAAVARETRQSAAREAAARDAAAQRGTAASSAAGAASSAAAATTSTASAATAAWLAARGIPAAAWAAAALERAAPARVPRGAFLLPDAAARIFGVTAGAAESIRPNIGIALDLVAAGQVAEAAGEHATQATIAAALAASPAARALGFTAPAGTAARAGTAGDLEAGTAASPATAGSLPAGVTPEELAELAAGGTAAGAAMRGLAEAARAHLPPALWPVFDAVYISLGEDAETRPLAPSARAARALALTSRAAAGSGEALPARARAAAAWAVLPVILTGGASPSATGEAARPAAPPQTLVDGARPRSVTRAGEALGALVAPTLFADDHRAAASAQASTTSSARGEARRPGVSTPFIETAAPPRPAPAPQPQAQPAPAPRPSAPAAQTSTPDMAWFVEAAKKYFGDAGPSSGGITLAEMTLVTAAPRTQIAASARTADRVVTQSASTTNVGGDSSKPGGPPVVGKPDVDKIAQEVFEQICRMMAVARERSGDPWQR